MQQDANNAMHRRLLPQGCRSIEIDCWDGEGGEPEVTHGHTLCSRVKFDLVARAVAECAFVASSLPVSISLEVHCCLSQQRRIVQLLEQYLGSAILRADEIAEISRSEGARFSPAQLEGRVIIKGKVEPLAAPSTLARTSSPVSKLVRQKTSALIGGAQEARSSLFGTSSRSTAARTTHSEMMATVSATTEDDCGGQATPGGHAAGSSAGAERMDDRGAIESVAGGLGMRRPTVAEEAVGAAAPPAAAMVNDARTSATLDAAALAIATSRAARCAFDDGSGAPAGTTEGSTEASRAETATAEAAADAKPDAPATLSKQVSFSVAAGSGHSPAASAMREESADRVPLAGPETDGEAAQEVPGTTAGEGDDETDATDADEEALVEAAEEAENEELISRALTKVVANWRNSMQRLSRGRSLGRLSLSRSASSRQLGESELMKDVVEQISHERIGPPRRERESNAGATAAKLWLQGATSSGNALWTELRSAAGAGGTGAPGDVLRNAISCKPRKPPNQPPRAAPRGSSGNSLAAQKEGGTSSRRSKGSFRSSLSLDFLKRSNTCKTESQLPKTKGRLVDPSVVPIITLRSSSLEKFMQQAMVKWPLPITSIEERKIELQAPLHRRLHLRLHWPL